MKPCMVLLPLDDRPVNYDYPRYLARLAGYELHLPPREWLGNPWRESQHARLVKWLADEAQSADVLILAIDTLAYGGLIPSRTSVESQEQVLGRLGILREIKTRHPDLAILASSVILRISRADSCEEEKDYWASYGSTMFRSSYLEHKRELGHASSAEITECESLRRQIPDGVYEDYRQGRRRNHAINQSMLDWLGDGIFDYLLLPQDDTADYGWNIAEARLLQARIRAEGLSERAITYPGADEVGCMLLAGSVCSQRAFRPRVWPRYSSINSPCLTTAYEDRPIHELLKAHLAVLRGTIADSPESADLILFLNAPCCAQGEGSFQWLAGRDIEGRHEQLPEAARAYLEEVASGPVYQNTRREMESPQRSPEEFMRALLRDLGAQRPVALADVAFANGSDLILGNLLVQHPEIVKLCAYGGWNTAGNTLGTVLAQAALRLLSVSAGNPAEQEQAHLDFLFLHVLEDFYYQARERTRLMLEDLPAMGLTPTQERLPSQQQAAVEARLRSRLEPAADELKRLFVRSGCARDVQVSHIHLPWQRLFEVGFDVQVLLPTVQGDSRP